MELEASLALWNWFIDVILIESDIIVFIHSEICFVYF